MSRPPLKAVSFDAAGTLIHLTESVGEAYSRVAAKFGIRAEPGALDAAFRRTWKTTPLPFSRQQGSFDEPTLLDRKTDIGNDHEKNWWFQLVQSVFSTAEIQIPDGQFPAFFEALYDHFESPGCWELDPDAKAVLAAAANRDLGIALLSNFDSRLRRILADLDILDHFEIVILSSEVRASKPDPRIFDALLDLARHPAGSILHIGDDPECDWNGAARAGLQTYQLCRKTRPLSGVIGQILSSCNA
ncbi:MAG: HAD-IA family hydrolase [Verrucomicrobiales bacterium]|nr:HAD-IA family hydrolase [Verrucomicrobiales bacterium]